MAVTILRGSLSQRSTGSPLPREHTGVSWALLWTCVPVDATTVLDICFHALEGRPGLLPQWHFAPSAGSSRAHPGWEAGGGAIWSTYSLPTNWTPLSFNHEHGDQGPVGDVAFAPQTPTPFIPTPRESRPMAAPWPRWSPFPSVPQEGVGALQRPGQFAPRLHLPLSHQSSDCILFNKCSWSTDYAGTIPSPSQM